MREIINKVYEMIYYENNDISEGKKFMAIMYIVALSTAVGICLYVGLGWLLC